MVPMDVIIEGDGDEEHEHSEHAAGERETRFYTCHVCGDNWLSVKETAEQDCTVTFVHQMGMQPELKRIAHMDTPILLGENTVSQWEYFLDNEQIDGTEWHQKLTKRREVLKSICSN